ncbi:putative membrane protein [Leptolyngbyaceae cyanobacterium JSC-12]|nr:putative membrane protein [Leptolyngbyaceae cyanobacterium JSC-12]
MTIAKRIPLLALILLLGAILRFWNLDLKPLWMDEVITALFSLGRTYYDVPLEQALPLTVFEQVFTLNPETSCAQIALTVSTQSVHPPLFFCWMHQWMGWVNLLPISWVWKLRALPALFGIVAIVAIYQLNRIAFSHQAGLLGAVVMAISPFGVYLSQEARHYTLPMLLVILALSGLYQVLIDLHQRQFRPLIWLGWVAVNSLGFYVHYFFLLAFVGQVMMLLWLGRGKNTHLPYPPSLIPFPLFPLLAIALVCLTYLPWLSTLLSHISRPETDWVKVHVPGVLAAIAPLLQIVSGWVLTGIAFPVEGQPVWIAAVNGLLMAVFSLWLVRRVFLGVRQLWQHSEARLGIQLLLGFGFVVVLEFLAIAYILGKDFTQVPRYNFIYFPAVCALVGAGLSQPLIQPLLGVNKNSRGSKTKKFLTWLSKTVTQCDRRTVFIVLLVGILSSVFVVSDQVFQKPYRPDQVARTLLVEPQEPLLVTTAYNDYQDVALGLSFALQLAKQERQQVAHSSEAHFAFIAQFSGYEGVWSRLLTLQHPLPFPLNLWVIGPGLKRIGYPQQLMLGNQSSNPRQCNIVPDQYHRLGIPYQLYHCP